MAQVEREKVVPFEFNSRMNDVGKISMTLLLKRRTASLVTEIKLARAKMLGGLPPADDADNLHFDVMATLANGVEPVPNPTPMNRAGWFNEILDPACWYAIYDRWLDYQNSFSEAPVAADPQAPV